MCARVFKFPCLCVCICRVTEKQEENKGKTIHLLAQSPSVCSNWSWASLKPGAENSAGQQDHYHHHFFQEHLQGSESEVQVLETLAASTWISIFMGCQHGKYWHMVLVYRMDFFGIFEASDTRTLTSLIIYSHNYSTVTKYLPTMYQALNTLSVLTTASFHSFSLQVLK